MLALVLIVGVIFWSLFSGVWLENSSVFKENGLLENTQAFTLTITLLFFLAPMFNRFRSDRLLAVFFSFLTLGFILRELDIETFDLPNILILLGSGQGRNLLLAVGILSTLGCALFKFRYYLDLSICFVRSRTVFADLSAGIFCWVGDSFENVEIPHNVLYEESLELVGYSLFLLAASRFARREVKTSRFMH
jgi:hypothetical protein